MHFQAVLVQALIVTLLMKAGTLDVVKDKIMKKIITLILIAITFSSCYTIQEATRNDNPLTRCTFTSQN